MCVSVFPCVRPSVLANFSAMLSLFGGFEASLELARQGHTVFWVSHNFTHSFTQFHSILAILANFRPIPTCWALKCMCLSWEIQLWYFHALSRTPSCNFTQFSRNLGYYSHFWDNFYMLGIKMHVLFGEEGGGLYFLWLMPLFATICNV